MTRNFTGRHMAAILVGFFAVVFAVNMLMARLAGSTFGGVVVENSYVASQHYNSWLEAARRQAQLGWTIAAARGADGRVIITATGLPAAGVTLNAVARHPLGRAADVRLGFAADAQGRWQSDRALPAGRWILRIAVDAPGARWRGEEEVL